MSSQTVTLETIFGVLELRPRRGPSDENKVPVAMCEGSVERALQDALAWGNALAVLNLARDGGFIRLAFGIDDEEVVTGLMDALRGGQLVVAAAGMTGTADDHESVVWAAYYAFASRFGKEFNLALRRHRIVAREQVADIRQANDYDVVSATEAAAVVVGLSKSAGVGPWQAAATILAKHIVDMRSPPGSGGFMLLREPASQAERIVSPEDVITPAKLKKLKQEKEAVFEIEIERRYHDDSAVHGAKFTLVFEGGMQINGVLDSAGKATVKGVPNEAAEVSFSPDVRSYEIMKGKKNKAYQGQAPTDEEIHQRLEFFLQQPQP